MIEYTGLIILDGSTSEPAMLAGVLDAFASTPNLAPEFWGATERVRHPYSAEAIQQLAAREKLESRNFYQSTIILSRAKKLGYKAMLYLTDASVGQLHFWFKNPRSVDSVRGIYESVAELVEKLPLVYGAVHPVAREGDEVAGLTRREAILCLEGVFRKSAEIKQKGLPRPCARTWYGPVVTERTGSAVLEQVGAKPSGENMLLDLVPEPWAATISQLFARQTAVLVPLRQTGMFAEREVDEQGFGGKTTRGSDWIPPAWVLSLGDKKAKAEETKAE